MSYKFEGEVKIILDTQTFDSGFKKREIILTSDDRYPQDVKFEFLKDDVDMLKSIKVNDRVIMQFEIRGNEYNGKYYNNLIGTSITNDVVNKTPKVTELPETEDDLPF